jgi:hypothetical protein
MKSATTLLVGLVALLLLVIIASLSFSAGSFITAYVELQQQPESVTDIIMRSRTTASALPPERQNGQWLGAGLLAIVLLLIAGLFALMLGGDRLLRQWRLTFKRHLRQANPPYPPQEPRANPHAYLPTLPTPLTPPTPRTGQLPPWNDEEF